MVLDTTLLKVARLSGKEDYCKFVFCHGNPLCCMVYTQMLATAGTPGGWSCEFSPSAHA